MHMVFLLNFSEVAQHNYLIIILWSYCIKFNLLPIFKKLFFSLSNLNVQRTFQKLQEMWYCTWFNIGEDSAVCCWARHKQFVRCETMPLHSVFWFGKTANFHFKKCYLCYHATSVKRSCNHTMRTVRSDSEACRWKPQCKQDFCK